MKFKLILIAVFGLTSQNIQATQSVGFGLGTTGYVLTYATKFDFLPEKSNIRVSYSFFDLSMLGINTNVDISKIIGSGGVSIDTTVDNVHVQGNVQPTGSAKLIGSLMMIPVLIDWHPFDNGFRLSTGVAYSDTKLEVTANDVVEASINIDDNSNNDFTLTGQGDIDATLAMKGTIKLGSTFVPYLGLGYGYNIDSNTGLKFNVALGLYLQGAPKISFTISPVVNLALITVTGDEHTESKNYKTQIETGITNETGKFKTLVKDKLKSFTVFPHLSVGLEYKFN